MGPFASTATLKRSTSADSNARMVDGAAVDRRTTSYFSNSGKNSNVTTKHTNSGSTVSAQKATLAFSANTSWKFVQGENTCACMVPSVSPRMKRTARRLVRATATKPLTAIRNSLESFASTRAQMSVPRMASREQERPVLLFALIMESARTWWTQTNRKYMAESGGEVEANNDY